MSRLVLACLLGVGFGCGQQPTDSPSSAEPASAGVEAAPNPNADEAQQAALLAELTQAVRRYGVEQRRAPKNLEELVAGRYLNQVPPAPPGKRYAIDKNLRVYLSNE